MRSKLTTMCFLACLLAACTLTAPQTSTVPTSPPTAQPTTPPTDTPLPTSSPTPLPSSTPSPTRTITLRPTLTGTATRIPTPLLRVSEVPGKQCPFNQAVKIVAPGTDPGGFAWQPVITPLSDACVSRIRIAPNDARTWFVGGQSALYVTRDEGITWERPLSGQVSEVVIDPANPEHVLVAFQVARTLYESTNQGKTWKLLKKFDQDIMSLKVTGDGTIFVGPHWGGSAIANGIYISRDKGATWQHAPFGTAHRGLIVWDVAVDEKAKIIYVGTEIYDHPKPYSPPAFRSKDSGKTWEEITGTLPWHVIAIHVSPRDGTVMMLTEGAGLYGSGDHGDRWTPLGRGPSLSLAADPNRSNILYGGALAMPANRLEGGVYVSYDGGRIFNLVGLRGVTISALTLSPDGKTLFAAAYSSGIYRARLLE